MPEDKNMTDSEEKITKPLQIGFDITRLSLPILVLALILGTVSGYILAKKPNSLITNSGTPIIKVPPKNPQQDTTTFRDFAEGVIKPNTQTPNVNGYTEGTHFLEREGGYPVTLTSSVVDLSQYEGKKVKVYGETQKALKAGWLMDVGRVDEIK